MVLQAHSTASSVNGLLLPLDFDVTTYDVINNYVSSHVNSDAWKHFAGGWSGVSVRFLSCCESSEAYSRYYDEMRVSQSSHQRYLQDRELFNFFVSGLSALEDFSYSLYALGAIKDRGNFPVSAKDFKTVDFKRVTKLFTKCFPPSQLSQVLSTISSDVNYQEWSIVRNILIHRVLPGRTKFLSTNIDNARPDEWKLDDHDFNPIPLDAQLTVTRRAWLSNTMNSLLIATQNFITAYGI